MVSSAAAIQLSFLPESSAFPSTRFQGSKAKLTEWIWDCIRELHFESALDAFGGTGAVAYMLKQQGKTVTYNDILRFNWYIGLALIENDHVTLAPEDIAFVLSEQANPGQASFVKETFPDIYFTEDENAWIDRVASNIRQLDGVYRQALAYFALFQSCIAKRPFNLFHRKNLYLRNSDVESVVRKQDDLGYAVRDAFPTFRRRGQPGRVLKRQAMQGAEPGRLRA
jgi:hypothetical protein